MSNAFDGPRNGKIIASRSNGCEILLKSEFMNGFIDGFELWHRASAIWKVQGPVFQSSLYIMLQKLIHQTGMT